MSGEVLHRTTEAYDHIARRFSDRWFDNPVMEPFLDRFIALVRGRGTVADVGCGPGRDAAYLIRNGVPAIGIDPSGNMLNEARRNTPQLPCVRADCRQLPLRGRSLVGIWACASILHVPRPEFPQVLAEFARVLDRGYLFVALKEGQGHRWLCLDAEHERFFVYYSVDEVEDALDRSGFEVLEFTRNEDESSQDTWINFYARLRT